MHELIDAVKSLIRAKWRRFTRYDFYGELQIDERIARRDLADAIYLLRRK